MSGVLFKGQAAARIVFSSGCGWVCPWAGEPSLQWELPGWRSSAEGLTWGWPRSHLRHWGWCWCGRTGSVPIPGTGDGVGVTGQDRPCSHPRHWGWCWSSSAGSVPISRTGDGVGVAGHAPCCVPQPCSSDAALGFQLPDTAAVLLNSVCRSRERGRAPRPAQSHTEHPSGPASCSASTGISDKENESMSPHS